MWCSDSTLSELSELRRQFESDHGLKTTSYGVTYLDDIQSAAVTYL